MAKTITAAVGGVLLGIVLALLTSKMVPSADRPVAEIKGNVVRAPDSTPDRLDVSRGAEQIGSEEVPAAESDFDRAAALYVLAGRSDSSAVQNLIYETNEIVDEFERENSLNILFSRLAEIEPRAALTLARMGDFAAIKSLERTVWRNWARKDFEDALFDAKTQISLANQNSAAQSLYAAFGYMGNEITDRIESELGIGPDRSSRGRYLYKLADRSPAVAIDFINSISDDRDRRDYVSWLAYYVSLRDPSDALRFAELFESTSDGDYYNRILGRGMAQENPQATLDRIMASGNRKASSDEYQYAIRALATSDIDAAKQYFEQARSAEEKRFFGTSIVNEMAKKDPIEALEWARENETGRFSNLQMAVLMKIATSDPQLALAEATKTPNVQMRSMMIANVVQQIAGDNPRDAVVFLDQIQDRAHKMAARQQLASSWMRSDPDAAMEWVMSQDEQTESGLVQSLVMQLVRDDVDAALRLLPTLDKQYQVNLRQQIAQSLAMNSSPAEAQSFIQQFEGQEDYDQLQASLISGVAQTDVMMAKQLADQMAAGGARDRAYLQVVSQYAQTDPSEAARWLAAIKDERLRSSATGQVAAQWSNLDPVAAAQWVREIPRGSSRDDAILHMSSRWSQPTREQQQLIDDIEDPEKRGQAKVYQIYHLMRTDRAAARRMLDDADIPDRLRQQAESMLSQVGVRFR